MSPTPTPPPPPPENPGPAPTDQTHQPDIQPDADQIDGKGAYTSL